MSWLFSQALAEEYSEGISSAGEQFVQLNVMPTPHKFSRNDKTMEYSLLSRFGLTCAVLTESCGEELLMSFLGAFRARTSAVQEKVPELTGVDPDFGGSSILNVEQSGSCIEELTGYDCAGCLRLSVSGIHEAEREKPRADKSTRGPSYARHVQVSLLQTERSRRSSHEATKPCYLVPCYRLSDDTGIHSVDSPFALRTANTGR